MADSNNPYGYDKLNATEIRKVIADLVKSNIELIDQKKEYNTGANEVIKETKLKIEYAVDALKEAERAVGDAKHESNVRQFLSSAGKQ